MHFKSQLHVRDHSKAKGTAHHLLQTIAQHVNMHTGEAFGPSVDRLADRLDITPQWVRQLRARLVAEGELILKPSRGRHPNVYIIPYERCPACQGSNPQVGLPVDIPPDGINPQVEDLYPDTPPERLEAATRNTDPTNPKLVASQPESQTAATRNSDRPNPKLAAHLKAVLERIERRKEVYKEEKESKEGATRKSLEGWWDKAERRSPYWCETHGYCHSEPIPDHRLDCARER